MVVSHTEGKVSWLSVFCYGYQNVPRHCRSFIPLIIISSLTLARQLPYNYVTNQSQHYQCVDSSWRKVQGTRCNYGLQALKENFTGVIIFI